MGPPDWKIEAERVGRIFNSNTTRESAGVTSWATDLLSTLVFRMATDAERPAVLRFRKEAFEQEHDYAPLDSFDDAAIHLVAIASGRGIVSTARLLLPRQRPFEIEALVDFHSFLGADAVPAMVGGFSVDPEFRSINKSIVIQLGMLKLTFALAER